MKLKIHKENSPIGKTLGEVSGVVALILIPIVDFSSSVAKLYYLKL